MVESIKNNEPLVERTLALFRRIGNVVIVVAGVSAVLYPPIAPVAGAIIGVELAQNAISKRFSEHLNSQQARAS